MAVTASTFQAIANTLINTTFSALAKSATLKQQSGGQYPGDPVTFNTESGSMIPIELEKSQFEQLDVQVGDKLVVAYAQDWTLTPTVNDVLTFDGQDYNIVNIIDDAADAAYFIQIRR